MYAESFEFNGIDSKDANIYIMGFESFNDDGVASIGDNISFTTTKAANSDRLNFHGYTREECLTTTFQIGKNPCELNDPEFTREELAFIKNWLERKDGYHFLRFFQEGYEDTYFYCQNHIEWIRVQGKIVGADVSVTCNAPYGYSGIQGIDVVVPDGGSFIVYNDSDEQGGLEIDQIEIGISSESTCNITIENNLENYYSLNRPYKCTINNCNPGEHIVISGLNHTITTSDSHQARHTDGNISSDFNFHYPRLINISTNLPLINYIPSNNNYPTYDENRINKFTVTGAKCNINFAYRTIRSVMP